MKKDKKRLDINSKLNWSVSPWISDKVPLSEAIKFLEKKFKVNIEYAHVTKRKDIFYTWWSSGFNSLNPMNAKEIFQFITEFNSKFGFINYVWLNLENYGLDLK